MLSNPGPKTRKDINSGLLDEEITTKKANELGDAGMLATTSFGSEYAFLKIGEYFNIPLRILKPLGLGSTDRTVANNLVEQMAMKDALENPQLGRRLMEGMKDSRWPGWTKMEYKVKTAEGVRTIVHYLAKWENGVLKTVDDFKFK